MIKLTGSTREPNFPAHAGFLKNKPLLWDGSQNKYHQQPDLAPSDDLGHSNVDVTINSPDRNVNKIHKSALILLKEIKSEKNTRRKE
jgi:hypothetical protein